MLRHRTFTKYLFCGTVFTLFSFTAFAEETGAKEPKSISISRQAEYTACGCGCCNGVEPEDHCLYKTDGDSLQKIMLHDFEIRSNSQVCATAGCSKGTRYHYCD